MDLMAAMRLFAKVVDSGSFSAAARELDLNQSSISRHVSALEDRLGITLLNRTTRRLSLTEAGQIYYERATAILAEVEEADQAVLQLGAAPRGTLRAIVPVVFGRLHVAPALPSLLAEYPELRVDLTLTDHGLDLLEEGADLSIQLGIPDSATLIARKLADNPWVICGSPEYLRRHGTPRTPRDLERHNCLTRRTSVGSNYLWQFRTAGGALEEIEVTGSLQTNNPEALRATALGGLGLARLSSWTVGKDLACGALVRVLTDYEVVPLDGEGPVYAVTPSNRYRTAKVRVFVDHMAQWLASHDPTRSEAAPAAAQTARPARVKAASAKPAGAKRKGAA
jgi:DNA-binding transcriptional LysR family regulator